MKIETISLWLFVYFSLVGCECGSRPSSPERPRTSESTATDSGAVAEASPAPPTDGSQRVELDSEGVTIIGSFWAPSGPQQPAILLVHQLSSNRDEWRPLVELIRRDHPSWSVLAIDMRGHGESVQRGADRIAWRQFSRQEWREIQRDVEAALRFLRSDRGGSPSRIALVGSSIGSSACILATAAELGSEPAPSPAISALVMLSPGLSYHGLETAEPMSRLGESRIPVLAFAADEDGPSAEAITTFSERTQTYRAVRVDGEHHGVRMAQDSSEIWPTIVGFINEPSRP